MAKNPFLTSLQDLVFGLFGGVALLVIVLSTFDESESSIRADFVFVEVTWKDDSAPNNYRKLVDLVKLGRAGGSMAAPPWLYHTEAAALEYESERGAATKSIYYAGPIPASTWTLTYPAEAIVELQVRTKRGVTRYPSGTPIRVETVEN